MKKLGLLCTGLGFLLLLFWGARLFSQPVQYESTIHFSMDPNETGVQGCFAHNPRYVFYDEWFLKTQFNYLTSKVILDEVATRLFLQDKWSDEHKKLSRSEIYNRLKKSIHIFQDPDTSVIVLTVQRPNPDEAANIANKIIDIYREYRMYAATQKYRQKFNQKQQAIQNQRQKIDQAEQQLNSTVKDTKAYFSAEGELALEKLIYARMVTTLKEEIATLGAPIQTVQILRPAQSVTQPIPINISKINWGFLAGNISLIFTGIMFLCKNQT